MADRLDIIIHAIKATNNFNALTSQVLKANHLAIRMTWRALKKVESNGNKEEISDAKYTLQEVLDEKEEAKLWIDWTKAIDKWNERLAEQIEKGKPQSAIEETKKFIKDAEDLYNLSSKDKKRQFSFNSIQRTIHI